jgi:hypothetical protein
MADFAVMAPYAGVVNMALSPFAKLMVLMMRRKGGYAIRWHAVRCRRDDPVASLVAIIPELDLHVNTGIAAMKLPADLLSPGH